MKAEFNRHYLLRTATKLLRRECGSLQLVTDYFANGEALLACHHRRDAGLLPLPEPEPDVDSLYVDDEGDGDVGESVDEFESGTSTAGNAGTDEDGQEDGQAEEV